MFLFILKHLEPSGTQPWIIMYNINVLINEMTQKHIK